MTNILGRNMSTSELLQSYLTGDYNYYLQLTGDSSSHDDLLKLHKDLKLTNFSDISTKFLLLNNEALCHAIIEMGKDEQKWLESLNSFIKLYSNYKSLLVIPVELEMNVIYNILWWFWTNPWSLQSSAYYLKNVLKALSWCLIKVLRLSGEVVLGQEMYSDNVPRVINLLKLASDHLLSLKPVACIQLLDIITMTVQVLLRERIDESAAECMSFMTKIINEIDLLGLHIGKIKAAGAEEFYFKFGLKCINSTASLMNSKDSIEAFVVTCSLNCAVNEQYENAISCFKGISDEGSCNFLMNYMKAHCCVMSGRLSEAKLSLAYAMSGPAPPLQLAHYRLLLARLLGVRGDHQAALAQCDAVLASHTGRPALTSLAAHLAAQQAEKLNTTTAQLNYLRLLVQGMKADLTERNAHFESFEECCLIILSDQFSITMPEALYTLARQLYLAGYHVKSLDSYKELLELIKTHVAEASTLLPGRSQIVQECILAHIKCNSLSEGEQLCRELVGAHLPHTGGGRDCSRWEVALYSLEDDVVTLLLLADILTASGNKRKALEELNRCHSALTEWRDQVRDKTDTELCDWLLSRVFLRKAKISNVTDAAHYYRRALVHRPGDKEAMFQYKQWSLWHPDHDSFDPGDATAAVVFPADDVHNLAARHLLGCGVRDEEWDHLFDRHTSQNIIESLFDDDDD